VEEGPNAAAKAGEAIATQKGAAPKTILKQLIERGL